MVGLGGGVMGVGCGFDFSGGRFGGGVLWIKGYHVASRSVYWVFRNLVQLRKYPSAPHASFH